MAAEADVLEQLVQRSHSPDAEVRSAAVHQIMELPDEALLQLLSRRSRYTGAGSRRLAKRLVYAFPYTAFAIAVAVALIKGTSRDPHILWYGACLIISYGAILMATYGYSISSMSRFGRPIQGNSETVQSLSIPLVKLLVDRDDRRFLPYLLSEIALYSALFERPRVGTDRMPSSLMVAPGHRGLASFELFAPHEYVQSRRRYRKIVQKMLSSIGPEETITLTPEEQYGLLLLVSIPEEDVQLTVEILSRLQIWGGAAAALVVKRLIREKHWYVGSEQVEAAARKCLEEIDTRLKRRQQGSTLLRPVGGSEGTSPRSLLRPAVETPETAPEQLLRSESAPPPERPG